MNDKERMKMRLTLVYEISKFFKDEDPAEYEGSLLIAALSPILIRSGNL